MEEYLEEYQSLYENIIRVLNQAKALSHTLNRYMKKKPNFEEDFLKKYRGKAIMLLTANAEVSGVLEDMNRYRIELKTEKGTRFYNKSTLMGYYAQG